MEWWMILSFIVIFTLYRCFVPNSSTRQKKPKKSTEWDEIKFFVDVNKKMTRDYTVIVDKSGSMGFRDSWFSGPTRWQEANKAIQYLAPHVTAADPDGITLYLFSYSSQKYTGIRDANSVIEIFNREKPGGGTNLAQVLRKALDEHFKVKKPETILVITDGMPNNKSDVKKVIVEATHKMESVDELSISFIQIGTDQGATSFLEELDDDLEDQGAKFDIVDTLTMKEMGSMTFSQLIQKSLLD